MAAQAMTHRINGCPDLEVIAAYLDHRLAEAERARVAEHLTGCETCYFVFSEASQTRPEIEVLAPRPWWRQARIVWPTAAAGLAAAATLALAVSGVLPWPASDGPVLDGLVAAVGTERPFEPRLTGGFAYGPLRTVRAGDPGERALSPDVRIAAALVEKDAAASQAPGALRARGIAALVAGEVDRAVAALEEAAARRPDDARILNDLAAAYLVRGERRNHAEDRSRALAAVNRALNADRTLAEAWFNRAFALERLSMTAEAREAWKAFLTIDDRSGWADEARAHLRALDRQP